MKLFINIISILVGAVCIVGCSSSSSTDDDKDAGKSDVMQQDVATTDVARQDVTQQDTAQADVTKPDADNPDARPSGNAETEVSQCAGFAKAEDRFDGYCDNEHMVIANDKNRRKVTLTHTRVFGNQCGKRSIDVTFEQNTSTYKVTEIDTFDDANPRCNGKCVWDYRVTIGYYDKPVKIRWYRKVTEENDGKPVEIFKAKDGMQLNKDLSGTKQKLNRPDDGGKVFCNNTGG